MTYTFHKVNVSFVEPGEASIDIEVEEMSSLEEVNRAFTECLDMPLLLEQTPISIPVKIRINDNFWELCEKALQLSEPRGITPHGPPTKRTRRQWRKSIK